MGKIIGIVSAKGGVGKTMITANLGVALASEFNKNVLLIDGNMTGSNLGYHFGINYPSRTIADVINERDSVNRCIYFHPSGVKIIPGPVELDTRIDPKQIEYVVSSLAKSYDYILIDSAPSLGQEALSAISASNEVLFVITPDIPCIMNTIKSIEISNRMGKKNSGIALNQRSKKMYDLTYEEIMSIVPTKITARIPYTEDIPKSIALQTPIVLQKPNSLASIEFKRLAANIAGLFWEPNGLLYRAKKLLGLVKERKPAILETKIRKDIQKAKMVDEVMREVLDVDKLKSEVTQEIRTEFREGIKKEILDRLRQKIKEKT
jgi:septum site-determining protein MinD